MYCAKMFLVTAVALSFVFHSTAEPPDDQQFPSSVHEISAGSSLPSQIANDLISDTIYCTDHIAAGEEVDGGEFEGLFDSLSRSLGDNISILKCID